jgi:hypothetical protein
VRYQRTQLKYEGDPVYEHVEVVGITAEDGELWRDLQAIFPDGRRSVIGLHRHGSYTNLRAVQQRLFREGFSAVND